jgi:hypothetical protein
MVVPAAAGRMLSDLPAELQQTHYGATTVELARDHHLAVVAVPVR